MSEAENNYWSHQCQCSSCEEYREQNQSKWDVAIIKSFVERVEARWEVAGTPYASAVNEELAAMEKANDSTTVG